jgi:hypothetical protein
MAIVVALALVAAVAVPTTIALRGGGGGRRVDPNSVGVIDPETGHIVRSGVGGSSPLVSTG